MLKKKINAFVKKMDKADIRFLKGMFCIFLSLVFYSFVGPYLIAISKFVLCLGMLLFYISLIFLIFRDEDFTETVSDQSNSIPKG